MRPCTPYRALLALGTVVLVSVLPPGSAAPQETTPQEMALPGESGMVTFPVVSGSNLEGQDFTLPRDFGGQVNLVFIAFLRRQQEDVDTWTAMARRLSAQDSTLRAYELPTIRRGNLVMRWVINQGMAAGVHDPRARAATITLYLDKDEFRRALAIAQEDEITVLLCGRDGRVLWRETGVWSEEKEKSLKEALRRR